MAYSVLLASVADDQVVAFREGSRSALAGDRKTHCSHSLTAWVQPNDLRKSLRLAIDGGEVLRSDLWHPLRVPVWHRSSEVAFVESPLRKAWNDTLNQLGPLDPSDWHAV